jgi:hypothetical protein
MDDKTMERMVAVLKRATEAEGREKVGKRGGGLKHPPPLLFAVLAAAVALYNTSSLLRFAWAVVAVGVKLFLLLSALTVYVTYMHGGAYLKPTPLSK